MRRFIRFTFLYLFLLGCIEPYEFVVKDNEPRLVVEGYISDKSYNETLLYPSDGRYFTVKLSYTSDVTNEHGQVISGASVILLAGNGLEKSYDEINPGVYSILDPDFKAEPGLQYKLRINLPGDEAYESSWESLPTEIANEMGEIGFDEIEKPGYKYIERVATATTIKGINAHVQLPVHDGSNPVYYKWDFYSHWIFIAPIPPLFSPVKKCWVKNPYYLSDYTLQEDYKGGYGKNLFFVETLQNERILEDLTVLIRQEIVSKDYFFFLKELQDRDQGSLQSDRPPYNLKTNINSSNGEKSVVGYFAVINEQARRWYFNRNDLSYNVANTLRSTCIPNSPGPFVPPPGCNSCLEYTGGEPSTVEPSWWRN